MAKKTQQQLDLILSEKPFLDLEELGTEGFYYQKTTATWRFKHIESDLGLCIHEDIPNNLIGNIYHDLLFEAFIL